MVKRFHLLKVQKHVVRDWHPRPDTGRTDWRAIYEKEREGRYGGKAQTEKRHQEWYFPPWL